MSADIPEADWRRFKQIHATLTERFCAQILNEVEAACRATEGSAHDRYLKVYKLLEKRDREIAKAFNDFRRSTAVIQLTIMRRMDLLKDEELDAFSEVTRNQVRALMSL